MKTYLGELNSDGGGRLVKIHYSDGKERILPLKPSQEINNHSPDGFSWGYGGSGPAQLALAILLDVTGDKEKARKYYQDFKWDVIASFPIDRSFHISEEEVKGFLIGKMIIGEKER